MKTVFKRLAGLAAIAALAAPTFAQAGENPAGKLSIDSAARPSSTSAKSSKLSGSTATIVNIGILAGLVAIILVATNGGNDDSPDSN